MKPPAISELLLSKSIARALANGCHLLSQTQWPCCLPLSHTQNYHPAKVSSDPGYLAIPHRAFLAIFYLLSSIISVNNVCRALTTLSSRQLLLLPDTTTSRLCLGSCLHTAIGLRPPSNHCASQLLCRIQCYLCFGAFCLFSISSYLAQVCVLLFSLHHQHQRSITPPACFIAPFLPPKPLASYQIPSCDANIPSPGCLLCRSSLCPASIHLIFSAQWGSRFEDGKVSALPSWGELSLPFTLTIDRSSMFRPLQAFSKSLAQFPCLLPSTHRYALSLRRPPAAWSRLLTSKPSTPKQHNDLEKSQHRGCSLCPFFWLTTSCAALIASSSIHPTKVSLLVVISNRVCNASDVGTLAPRNLPHPLPLLLE